jgi:hypothetical protein
VPSDAKEHARKVAEAVDEAWHGQFGGSRIEIPISVVAALALVSRDDPDGPDPTEQALALSPAGFAELLRSIWNRFAIARPDLLPRTKPLWEWLDDEPDEVLLRAVHATGRAALRKGQLELTGVEWRRHSVDLLGMVLQTVRSRSARNGLGQFLTPESVTMLLGRMVAPRPGNRILEPCGGTGTMLLGAAQAMRDNGDDPTTCEWWANDIDWLAAACCAINMHCWGLGARVVIGCGDGLGTEWMRKALDERQAAIDEVAALWEKARMLAAVRELFGLGPAEDPLERHLREAQPKMPKAPPLPPPSSTFDADAVFEQGALF